MNLKKRTESLGIVAGIRAGGMTAGGNLRYGVVEKVNGNGTVTLHKMEDGLVPMRCMLPQHVVPAPIHKPN